MKNKFFVPLSIFIVLFALLVVSSCKKPDLKTNTTEDVNAVSYLAKHPDSFSLWKQILDRTETSAFLDAYGLYTIFAPTNDGVKAWLTSIGATSVETADLNTLKDIVRFHVLEDTISTPAFKDGKLPVATMYGQFLITGVSSNNGASSISVNRQASVVNSNIRVGNGYIHEIDHVLVPAKLTIAKALEANPDYSIFVQALKETGYFDLLNTIDPDPAKRWKTVIAETNKDFADSSIASYAALKAKYSNTGNPANPLDSLNLYVAYHIMDGINFLGDIITSPSHLTLQPQEVISTQLINNEVVLNQDEFNGIIEKGIVVVRSASDNAATNGVWHTAGAHFAAKFRKPAAVYWDVATFPEITKQPAYYKKQNLDFNKSSQEDRPIASIDWERRGENYIGYRFSTSSSLQREGCNQDNLQIPLGCPSCTSGVRASWVEFTTPPIIKGRYKVWICYRNRSAVTVNVFVNGELMQRPVNLGVGYPGGSDAELESLGWKKYTSAGGSFAARLAGIIEIKTTQRQTLRLEAISGTNRENFLDMVHFIPVDENQVLPRFAPDGSKVYQ